jgi:predicted anti-sigma-YlaC factor YlaD
MECSLARIDLAAYHLGATEEETRASIDAHLLECSECLRAYLAVKRHVEERTAVEQPSDAARLRLRAAVESRFRPTSAALVVEWFRRPVPLYKSLAFAAMVVAAAVLAPILATRAPHYEPTALGERIDTSSPTPRALGIY